MDELRKDYIYRRAFDLAAGGAHISASTVISELVEEGYPEAGDMLSTDLIQADLNLACAKHWQMRRFIQRT